MPELKNSQRILRKATHVTTVPNIINQNSQDKQIYSAMTRAVPKAAFVRSLRINKAEITQLKKYFSNPKLGKAAVRKKRTKALNAIAAIVNDKSPMALFKHASKFKAIENDLLSDIGKVLYNNRKDSFEKIQNSIKNIQTDYAASESKAHAINQVSIQATKAKIQKSLAAIKKLKGKRASDMFNNLNQSLKIVASISTNLTSNSINRSSSQASISQAFQWAAENNHPQFLAMHKQATTQRGSAVKFANSDPVVIVRTYANNVSESTEETVAVLDAFKETLPIEPVGKLHLERIEMTPYSIERGELVYSIPLTAGETVNISHREWSQTTQGYENIVEDEFIGYSEKGVTEKNDMSEASESESKHSTALNVGVSLSASYSGVTLSSSFGYNTNSDNTQSEKDSRAHSSQVTSKASARSRKEHKVSFKVSSVAGTEDLAVRVLTNQTTSPVRVDYYRMMRKWKVNLNRYGLRMTYDIVIPSPGAELMTKINKVYELDELLNTPLQFSLTPEQIDRTNWYTLATKWLAKIDPPSPDTMILEGIKPFTAQDPGKKQYDSLIVDIDPKYKIASGSFGAIYDPEHDPQKPSKPSDGSNSVFDLMDQPPGPSIGWGGYGSSVDNIIGLTGTIALNFTFFRIFSGIAQVHLKLQLTPEAFLEWQFKAWNTMREAAQQLDTQNRSRLTDQRNKLIDEINAFDGLTLRQMEREEIMKGVLRWLFGPDFSLMPSNINSLFTAVPDDPLAFWLDTNSIQFPGTDSWQNVIQFGEFIKYIHNAIEWENVLYINYPYFWDTAKNWKLKKFLQHPDPIHRMFLRSGAARVVLTIRPGFETSFTTLMEQGSFSTVPQNHPYIAIANEIQNFSKTNYPGIPPANPDNNVRPQLYLEQKRVWREMQYIMQLLQAYIADPANSNSYPPTNPGLSALQPYVGKVNATNTAWNTDPINAAIIALNLEMAQLTPAAIPVKDFWGNPYFYKYPGNTGDYDLISYGADGIEGGSEKNADISANANGSLIATWFEYTPTSALDVAVTSNLPTINSGDMA